MSIKLNIQNWGCIWLQQSSTYLGMHKCYELEPCCTIANYNNINWDFDLKKKSYFVL